MSIFESILDTVGDTPVVRLSRMSPPGVDVFVKVEAANPMGSVKDRLALGIIEAAERSGELGPGQTVIEATSGNTGLGLAMVCAAKGYPLVVVMAENFSLERRKMLRFLGARLVLTPPWAKGTGMLAVAEKLAKENGWYLCRQFENEAGADVHSRTTAAEILRDFGENGLTAWVSGFGTGGTLKGVARVLRERSPSTKIIVAEPENSALIGSGIPQGNGSHPAFHPHPMQGWSPDFISKLAGDAVGAKMIDHTITVGGAEAIETAVKIARMEGIFCGITSGATLAAALKFAQSAEPGSRVLAMLPDTGERYLSTPLFADVGVEMNGEEAELLRSAMPALSQPSTPVPVDARQASDEAARRFVREAVSANSGKVVMFALSWCEFCWSVRRLFERMGVPFLSIDLDAPKFRADHDVQKVRSALQEITGAATIPQIFIGGEWIGGSMEVMEAAESGDLQRLLERNSIPCSYDGEVSRYDFLPNWVRKQPQAA